MEGRSEGEFAEAFSRSVAAVIEEYLWMFGLRVRCSSLPILAIDALRRSSLLI
jgi:hypothetical protein